MSPLLWKKLQNITHFINIFLNNQQINNCFGAIPHNDLLLLKCWQNNQLIDIQLTLSYFI
tara:strand:+ start:774 stop:953 length:180 start_codon:yes stop_codon:yes gene_type:complete